MTFGERSGSPVFEIVQNLFWTKTRPGPARPSSAGLGWEWLGRILGSVETPGELDVCLYFAYRHRASHRPQMPQLLASLEFRPQKCLKTHHHCDEHSIKCYNYTGVLSSNINPNPKLTQALHLTLNLTLTVTRIPNPQCITDNE